MCQGIGLRSVDTVEYCYIAKVLLKIFNDNSAVTRTNIKVVLVLAANQVVVATITEWCIDAVAAAQRVDAGPAEQRVVAGLAEQRVVAAAAFDDVVAGAAMRHVVAVGPVVADDQVVAVEAVQDV